MLWKTHLLIGIIILILSSVFFKFQISFILILLVILGTLLPDIDEKNSKLGRKAKIVSFIFDHRGFFHTIFALTIFSIIVHETLGKIEGYVFAVIYASHLILDATTKKGIKPLYPFQLQIKGNLKSGGIIEKIFFYLLIITIVISIFYWNIINF